jgi:hypothetical protein
MWNLEAGNIRGNTSQKSRSVSREQSLKQPAEAKAFAEHLRPLIEQLAGEGMSMTAVAAELNRRKIKTPGRAGQHGRWHSQTVKRLVARLATSSEM